MMSQGKIVSINLCAFALLAVISINTAKAEQTVKETEKGFSFGNLIPNIDSIIPEFLKSNNETDKNQDSVAAKPDQATPAPEVPKTYRVYPSPRIIDDGEVPRMPVYNTRKNEASIYGAEATRQYDLPAPPKMGKAPVTPPTTAIGNQFFPVLSSSADQKSPFQLLPIVSNHNLSDNHKNVERAIIFIHDITRNASEGVATLTTLSGNDNSSTLILAPQFPLEIDVARFATHLPQSGLDVVRWQLGKGNIGWQTGENSSAAGMQKGISSFSAVDLLLLYLADRKSFPRLSGVIIAGHGMGADFVQRYAAIGKAPDLLAEQNLPVRFLVANASSYLYFTSMRPSLEGRNFGIQDSSKCPNMNSYPYGLNQLVPYAKSIGGNALKLRFPERRVIYLLAGSIVNDPFLDTNCAAETQGKSRFDRGRNFERHVSMSYGDLAEASQKFVRVPNAGYDPVAMFGSYCGLSTLFGDGTCSSTAMPR